VDGQTEAKRHPYVVDLLFSSLAVALGDKAVGIVLSGTGNDGALGLKAIRDGGGIAMAQGPQADGTYFEGMPNAAIAAGAVDMFLPVAGMAERLLHLMAYPPKVIDDLPPEPSAVDLARYHSAICAILLDKVGHDFSGYKQATFFRRLQRRMQLFHLGFEDYPVSCHRRG
jgi:two-component system CheB/CheR fusion protein